MPNHNSAPEKEISKEQATKALDCRFPDHWVLALEFVKKFDTELGLARELSEMVELFKCLISDWS